MRISNGVAGGFNPAIQAIKSSARGFRNFANYRVAILFHCGNATFPTLIHEEPDMLVNMNDQTHLDRSEKHGCLVLLWIASPITALAVWGFVKLVLFFKWAINESLA